MRETSLTPTPANSAARAGAPVSTQVVTVSFFRFGGFGAKIWAFAHMGLARWPLARLPGLEFFKLMGTGTGEGFTPVPDTGAVAILAAWSSLEDAQRAQATAPILKRYRDRAVENWTLYLRPTSVWGGWSGRTPFAPNGNPAGDGPVVALTRATVRPSRVLRFWARVPDISKAIGANPSVMFKIGVGEVPWFHQMTFSIWPDPQSMHGFARADGPHARAIRAVRDGGWFREELYARFALLKTTGTWGGSDPLSEVPQMVAAQ